MIYPEQFAQIHTQLKQTAGFQNVRLEALVQPRRIKAWSRWPKWEREAASRAPAEFWPVYQQVCHLEARWEYFDPSFSTSLIKGYCLTMRLSGLFNNNGVFDYKSARVFWDERLPADRQARYEGCYIFDNLPHKTFVVWRQGAERVELALYLGQDRLHPLPFSPLEYVETGTALRFLELWQLLFIPEAEQADYAEALGTLVAQVRHLFPEAVHLLPAHVTARFPAPPPVPGPDYRQQFQALAGHLRTVPGLSFFQELVLPPGASLGTFERVRRELGFALPAELRAFYGQLNGTALRWELLLPEALWDSCGREAQGSLNFWSLEHMMGGKDWPYRKRWDGSAHLERFFDEEHLESVPGLPDFHPFESWLSGEWLPGLFLPTAPGEPARMALLAGMDTDELEPLHLSFAQYLAAALAGAGVQKWQLFYWGQNASASIAEHLGTKHIRRLLQYLRLDAADVLRYRLA